MYTPTQFASSNRLPTLPEVALRLVEIANQEEPDFDEIGQIIRSDPVVSGKILKTVNSALFGLRIKVGAIEQALPKLGVTMLRTLILSFHLARHKAHRAELEPVFQAHWRSSLTQAVFAELIAEQVPQLDAPTCFLAGMLQDIGILAMISEAPEEYLDVVMKRAEFPDVATAERSHFGFSHVDVSAEIVNGWGMSEAIVEAVAHHHDRIEPSAPAGSDQMKAVLQAATMGTAVLGSTRSSAIPLNAALVEWMGFLASHFGFSDNQTEEMISEVNHRVREYSVVFNFNIGESVQAEDVVARAKDLLQEIALKNQLELLAKQPAAKKRRALDDELYRDCLSGLFNRRFMSEDLNKKVEYCVKKRKPIGLLFLDVDKFKLINDTHGHSAGDKAIKHVAEWLNDSIRNDDVAIRLGGDEFLVILQKVNEAEFQQIATRIAENIPPMELATGENVKITLSVGGTFYQPVRGDTANANWLIEQADQSMYKAKKAGGDSTSVQVFVGTQSAEICKTVS